VTEVNTDRATITWTTDEPADSRLGYGKAAGVVEREVREGGLERTHTVVLTGLAPGTRYFIQLGSADAAGNLTNSDGHVFVTLTPDTNAPSRPSRLQADAVSPTAIDLRWAASDDDRGVAGYTVFRDGAPIATVTSPAYHDAGLRPETTCTYTIRAQDAAGNVSATSAAVTATTLALPPPPPAPPVPADPPKALNVQPDLIRLDGWPELQVRWMTSTPAIGWIEHEVSGLGWITQSPTSPLGTTHRAALRVDTRYRNYTLTLIIQDLVSGRKIRQPLPMLW
jgi:chitodextrinase